MSSNINTENVNASIETPLLSANLSSSTLVGSMNSNTLTGVSNANTLEGAIGSAVIGGGIKSIYVNNHEQSVSNDIAYITLTYDMIYNLPTIPTKLSELENDEGFINSGYASEDDFTALSNQVGLMDNNLSSLNNEVDSISSDIDTINETLTNKVNQTDFNNLQTQVQTNTNNIGTNTTNIQTNTTNITTLTNITDAQAQTITSMTALIEDNSDDIETLQNDVSSINTALSNKVDTSTFNVLDAQVQTNTTAIAGKQDTLVSGTNIKTINSQSLLGNGDITITGGQATDVQINGTSITSNNTANIETNSTYNATTNKIATMSDLPVIPTNVSAFTNDAGYITNTVNDLTNYTLTSNLSSVATSGDYNDLSNIPTIPTKTSDLTNDSGFITNTDYASASTGGVVKLSEPLFNIGIGGSGNVYSTVNNYNDYQSKDTRAFISKGTLENVLDGKGLIPHVLYDNSSFMGGTITLSESATNYSRFIIEYANYDGMYQSLTVDNPNGKTFIAIHGSAVSNLYIYQQYTKYTINGTSITMNWSAQSRIANNSATTVNYSTSNSNTYIRKVIAFK